MSQSCSHPYNMVVLIDRYNNSFGILVYVYKCLACGDTWEEEARHS